MRKFISILLLTIYSFAASGASVQLHYCMQKISGISFSDQGDHCQHCGMRLNKSSSRKNCCHSEKKQVSSDVKNAIAKAIDSIQSIVMLSSGTFPDGIPFYLHIYPSEDFRTDASHSKSPTVLLRPKLFRYYAAWRI